MICAYNRDAEALPSMKCYITKSIPQTNFGELRGLGKSKHCKRLAVAEDLKALTQGSGYHLWENSTHPELWAVIKLTHSPPVCKRIAKLPSTPKVLRTLILAKMQSFQEKLERILDTI